MISSGFTTPRPAVMTMARPTTATFFLYGEKVRTTRRTVAGLIGRGSSSSGRAPMPNMRPCRPIAFNDTAHPRKLRGRTSTRRRSTSLGGAADVGKGASATEHLVEHRRGELPREGVLLARVEASEDPVGADRYFHPVAEPRPGPRDRVAQPVDRPERPVPRERTQGNDHTELGECAELPLEEWEAAVALLGGRAIPGWGAPVHGAEVRPPQAEAVVHGRGRRPVREPGPVQRREQEVSRAIARKDPPCPVAAVCRRREPEDEYARSWVAEPRHRSPPIRLVREAGDLLPGDLLPPGHEPRASTTHNDVVPDLVEPRRLHGEPVPMRSKMS